MSEKGSGRAFMHFQFRHGALVGKAPEEAFFMKCDAADTITRDDMNNGKVVFDVGFAPLRPAEFVIFQIRR